jgi:hypothetical protein
VADAGPARAGQRGLPRVGGGDARRPRQSSR